MSTKNSEGNVLLKIDDVHMSFGATRVLEGVNVEIKDIFQEGRVRGQIRCLLGPSGIGKTVLLRMIAGLRKPQKGSIQISLDGQTLQPVEAGMVGVVAQDYPLFAHLTVLGNLVLAAKQTGISSGEAKQKAAQLLQRFGLGQHERFWPSQLSGGQRQRVAILQQVITGRLFLIMDEPFSGLDPKAIHKVVDLIHELAASDELHTSMIITHDIRAAVRVADRLHILGRQFDAQGNLTRAAHVVKTVDLLAENIAWQDNIKALPGFNAMVNDIEDMFDNI